VNRRQSALVLLAALLTGAILVACGDSAGPDSTPVAEARLRGKVTVFAAASLTDAFGEVATEFMKANPAVDVEFNFAGSPTLRTQLDQGARADIFASADLRQMQLARENGVVAEQGQVFARNRLVIITPSSNPGRISTPLDLRRDGLKLVLANPEVPVGAYGRQILTSMDANPAFGADFSAQVLDNVVSLESNVRQVVAKVELGEADGGIVYRSDVTPSVAPKLALVEIPAQFNVIAEYPIALTKDARNQRAAQAFIDYVLSPAGQAILARHGFI
jgi:molybdate transport system substrate-binding protein